MKYKKIILVLFAVIFFISAYIIWKPLVFGLCENIRSGASYVVCLDSSVDNVGRPLFLLSIGVLISVVFSFFLKREGYIAWVRIFEIMVSIALLLILSAPRLGGPGNFFELDIWDRVIAAKFSSTALVLLTLFFCLRTLYYKLYSKVSQSSPR